jgi:hypothetical protein
MQMLNADGVPFPASLAIFFICREGSVKIKLVSRGNKVHNFHKMDLFERAKKRLLDFSNLRRQNSQISDQINQETVNSPALKRFRHFVESRNSEKQVGTGVTTRSKSKEDVPKLKTTSQENKTEEIIEQESRESPAENPDSESPAENPAENPDENLAESTASESWAHHEHILFDHETLVSENSFLQAYVVKTLFKRQKRFAFDDHQVRIFLNYVK